MSSTSSVDLLAEAEKASPARAEEIYREILTTPPGACSDNHYIEPKVFIGYLL
jgi:hypothetical protein